MKIKRNIAFKLRPYGKDGNLFQIRMRVTFNGRRFDTKTGCQINDPSAWDAQSQLVAEGYVGPKGETAQAINNDAGNQQRSSQCPGPDGYCIQVLRGHG